MPLRAADFLLRPSLRQIRRVNSLLSLVLLALLATPAVRAQAISAPATNPADGTNGTTDGDRPQTGRIVLVLPFDNHGSQTGPDQSGLNWIREAAPEILNSRFRSAGFLPLGRADRLYALDHLGFPASFQPSRASTLRIAQTLDADQVIVGNYTATGSAPTGGITLEARVVDVSRLRMSPPVRISGELSQLIPLLDRLSWELTRVIDPNFPVAEETFIAAGAHLRLDAFEQYVRGLTEPDINERLNHLKKATQAQPDFPEAWLAMGRLYFAQQEYEQAAPAFVHATESGRDRLEAGFYRGLSFLYTGAYPHAEEAFAEVARTLPLPEVLNNQGVSLARRGKDGTVFFQQAIATDPHDADYHFNLALSLRRTGKNAEAFQEIEQALKLRPADAEILALDAQWKSPTATSTSAPLERIKRTYDEAAFRQAALVLDQVESAHLAILPPTERANRLSIKAQGYLDRGLLLEAEREFQSALAADANNSVAHAGLAEVRERSGDNNSARTEAQTSIRLHPNVAAYLVLARVNFAQSHIADAKNSTDAALAINPANKTAQALRKLIENRTASGK